jgi:hypothetical protein
VAAKLFHTDGRADSQTGRHDEANSRFPQFCEAPKAMTLPVVVCVCVCARARAREPWSLTPRAQHKFTVFKYGVLREIFGPKREEETRDWTNLCDEDLHDKYSSQTLLG